MEPSERPDWDEQRLSDRLTETTAAPVRSPATFSTNSEPHVVVAVVVVVVVVAGDELLVAEQEGLALCCRAEGWPKSEARLERTLEPGELAAHLK